MGKYIAIKEDGKICAAVGIYPFKTKILGQEFTFSTVGNVVTHPQYEGRGFKIINIEKITDALMKLKLSYGENLKEGSRVIEIEGYGKIRLYCENGTAGCEMTDIDSDIYSDRLSVHRLLF